MKKIDSLRFREGRRVMTSEDENIRNNVMNSIGYLLKEVMGLDRYVIPHAVLTRFCERYEVRLIADPSAGTWTFDVTRRTTIARPSEDEVYGFTNASRE